jgi:hypothetical protein
MGGSKLLRLAAVGLLLGLAAQAPAWAQKVSTASAFNPASIGTAPGAGSPHLRGQQQEPPRLSSPPPPPN